MGDNELMSFEDTTRLGDIMARSGFFADSRQAAQAIVKILAGRELGLGPVASMTGIYVISGRISLGANIIAAKIKGSKGRYDYKIKTLTDELCSIDFFENGKVCGNSTFTAADARRADTKNMQKFPKNMLFARAISNGAKWFCPDLTVMPIYTPEELGAETDEDGNVINSTATVIEQNPQPGQQQQPPDDPREAPITADQRRQLFALAGTLYRAPEKNRGGQFHDWILSAFQIESTNDLNAGQFEMLSSHMGKISVLANRIRDKWGNDEWFKYRDYMVDSLGLPTIAAISGNDLENCLNDVDDKIRNDTADSL